ncbi:imidazole glycerol phosphate synthase subunit HisH [Salisediminibacterium selenitireducens]|uniref:Imidazole glycerol phosphate synthase subunit HisH n=1 Tax=Bacillus selenitireducens (strain ATCC 700615 / DSM 15326 / MLS10) TaxID=439292 RepID=D6Y113_BACIE|nr:imidazole glycerol phosphate synthase subunit HisH [Salisediminibacterium selenitireducens]ADH98617.1 imidazole glycerol phosphate synthase, glutamine amidotransferase subunit [[Bacillus] selenitireducens MLS10]
MIGIIDYGMGNLHSVTKAVERLGRDCFLSEDPEELKKADCLILPGVGAFKDGMDELGKRGLVPFIHEWIEDGKPLLGICLGMQLLFDESEENGPTKGLSVLPGKVKKFPGGDYKVPHMGWNELTFEQPAHPVLQGLDGGHVYFVHSYFVVADRKEILIASAEYGGEQVTAVAGRDNVWGTQFHPEKSSVVGMTMLKNFVEYKGGAV